MIDWRQWHNEPIVADLLVLLGWLYAMLAGPLRARLAPAEPWPRKEAIRFFCGLGLFYLAASSPLARIGGLYLFSAHIVLQMVIMYPAAGLILLGLPAWMIDPILARAGLRPVFSVLFRPAVTGLIFILVTSAWYIPKIFEWALRHPPAHALEHAMFFGASFLFWWPLLSRSRVFPAVRYGSRLIYLFCIEVAMTAVFSYILMAEHPMYPTYQLAPRLISGLDAQSDQVLGGILLSAVSSLVLVGALGVNFLHWAHRSEKR